MNFRAICVNVFLMLSVNAMAAEILVGQVAQISDPNQVGEQLRRGAEICFAAVNRSGGVHGKTVRLVARDRESGDADVVIKTRSLIQEVKPVAMLNLVGTSAMEALVKEKILDQAQIPVVGIRSGATSLHTPVHPWLFHTRANYAAEVEKALRHFATLGIKRVAFVHESSGFGKEVAGHFDAVMPKVGLSLVAKVTIGAAATSASEAVEPVVKAQPQAVLIAASSFATADLYQGIRSRGLSAHVTALSTTDGAQVVKRIGASAAYGLGIAQVMPDPTQRNLKLTRDFQEDFSRFSAQVGVEGGPNQGILEGYVAARVLVEGMKRAGPEISGVKLRGALEGIRNYDLGNFVIGFSPSSHSGSSFVDIAIVGRDGRMLR